MPAFKVNAGGIRGNEKAIQANVLLAGFYVCVKLSHRANPIGDVLITRSFAPLSIKIAMGQSFPRFGDLDGASKRERLSAFGARKQPAAAAPGTVHLGRKRNVCRAAMAAQLVVIFDEIKMRHSARRFE
jgi:hypothetical protein